MNKDNINTKHKLYIVGSARGVERYYMIDKLLNEINNLKLIHTGNLIKSIMSDINLKNLDDVSLKDYYSVVEPTAINIILAHLEHKDVLLDTHFHYMLPGISIHNITKLLTKVSKASVILITDTAENIYNKLKNTDVWFERIDNIRSDVLLNELYFDIYSDTIKKMVPLKSFKISTDRLNKLDLIEVKN